MRLKKIILFALTLALLLSTFPMSLIACNPSVPEVQSLTNPEPEPEFKPEPELELKPKPEPEPELIWSPELEAKIIEDYIAIRIGDKGLEYFASVGVEPIVVIRFYGIYNGCVAVRVFDNYFGYLSWIETIEIDGVKFIFSNSNVIHVWKEGWSNSFLPGSFQRAFDFGWLKHDDLVAIAKLYEEDPIQYKHQAF